LQRQSLGASNYIFCAKDDGELHEFKTFDADENVRRRMAKDTILLARISGDDLTAIEAKYLA